MSVSSQSPKGSSYHFDFSAGLKFSVNELGKVAITQRLFLSLRLRLWFIDLLIITMGRNHPKALLITSTEIDERRVAREKEKESQSPKGSSYHFDLFTRLYKEIKIKKVAITQRLFLSLRRVSIKDAIETFIKSQSPKGSSYHFDHNIVIDSYVSLATSQSPKGSSYHFDSRCCRINPFIAKKSQSPKGSSYHFDLTEALKPITGGVPESQSPKGSSYHFDFAKDVCNHLGQFVAITQRLFLSLRRLKGGNNVQTMVYVAITQRLFLSLRRCSKS